MNNILKHFRAFIAWTRTSPVADVQLKDDTMTVPDVQSSAIEATEDIESDRRFLGFVSGSLVDILQSTVEDCVQPRESCLLKLEGELRMLASLIELRSQR